MDVLKTAQQKVALVREVTGFMKATFPSDAKRFEAEHKQLLADTEAKIREGKVEEVKLLLVKFEGIMMYGLDKRIA